MFLECSWGVQPVPGVFVFLETTFSTNFYRKKILTGLYIQFDSLSPVQYKLNPIFFLIYRAFHIVFFI